jgi:uncharacterized DUF497 family protein
MHYLHIQKIMQIRFDAVKRDATLANRGLDFADAREVFAGPVFERVSMTGSITERPATSALACYAGAWS